MTKAEAATVLPPNFFSHDPLAANTPWFREFKRDISALPANPYSDEMLARMRKANGYLAAAFSGPWSPANYGWYTFPWQVVSGSTVPLTIPGTWAYNPASSISLLPNEPITFEGRVELTYPTAPYSARGDHHLLIYVRDEASGGFKELWEYYQAWVTRDASGQITAIRGSSWRKFDLLHGENPPADTSSTDAAGLPIAPLLLRYEEVARGSINHVLRTTFNNSDISPTHKWPARASAAAYNPNFGMPYGTRLRIKKSWWDENADAVLGVGTQARVIGEALRKYGSIVADGTSGSLLDIEGAADLRWDPNLPAVLRRVPLTAFEVVDTPPLVEIDGPHTVQVGESNKWTLTAMPADAPISSSNINVYSGDGLKLIKYAFGTITQSQRNVNTSFVFPKAGLYRIKPYAEWTVTKIGLYLVAATDSPIPAGGAVLMIAGGENKVRKAIQVAVATGKPYTGVVTVTATGAGLSAPYDLIFSNDTIRSISITPTSKGKLTLAAHGNGLEDPPLVVQTIEETTPPAASYTLSLEGGGKIGQPVTATVIPDSQFVGSIKVTPSGAGVTGSVDLKFDREMMRSVTFTPTQTGTLAVTGSNGAGLTDGARATKTIEK